MEGKFAEFGEQTRRIYITVDAERRTRQASGKDQQSQNAKRIGFPRKRKMDDCKMTVKPCCMTRRRASNAILSAGNREARLLNM